MSLTDSRIELPGRYHVIRQIATGGMASVWLAKDALLGRDVAVKVLAQWIAADPQAVTRFEREARMAARVGDHPNVVTVYDVGDHRGLPFIVMEFCSGGSVADRLRAGAISRSQALSWLEQAAAALDHSHDQGVIHRDVKPANLLLDERDCVAVGDFGIARMVADPSLTQTGQVLGTAAYLSPEQALGEQATAASDRYALATVAFELLTGRRPFRGEHIAAQALQHVESQPPASGLGFEVDEIFSRGMAKDQQDRYETAGRFVQELRHAARSADDGPTKATQVVTRTAVLPTVKPRAPALTSTTPTARPSRGPRRPVLALAALPLAAVVAAIIALVASGDNNRGPATDRLGSTATVQADRQRTESSTPPAATGEGAAGKTPGALNDQGFALLDSDPAAAIPILEASVAGFERQGGTADPITYGYALYNLGQAYLRSGRAREAILMFERRLRVSPSDRPGIVRQAIVEAQEQIAQMLAGASATETGDSDAEPGAGKKNKKKDR